MAIISSPKCRGPGGVSAASCQNRSSGLIVSGNVARNVTFEWFIYWNRERSRSCRWKDVSIRTCLLANSRMPSLGLMWNLMMPITGENVGWYVLGRGQVGDINKMNKCRLMLYMKLEMCISFSLRNSTLRKEFSGCICRVREGWLPTAARK